MNEFMLIATVKRLDQYPTKMMISSLSKKIIKSGQVSKWPGVGEIVSKIGAIRSVRRLDHHTVSFNCNQGCAVVDLRNNKTNFHRFNPWSEVLKMPNLSDGWDYIFEEEDKETYQVMWYRDKYLMVNRDKKLFLTKNNSVLWIAPFEITPALFYHFHFSITGEFFTFGGQQGNLYKINLEKIIQALTRKLPLPDDTIEVIEKNVIWYRVFNDSLYFSRSDDNGLIRCKGKTTTFSVKDKWGSYDYLVADGDTRQGIILCHRKPTVARQGTDSYLVSMLRYDLTVVHQITCQININDGKDLKLWTFVRHIEVIKLSGRRFNLAFLGRPIDSLDIIGFTHNRLFLLCSNVETKPTLFKLVGSNSIWNQMKRNWGEIRYKEKPYGEFDFVKYSFELVVLKENKSALSCLLVAPKRINCLSISL